MTAKTLPRLAAGACLASGLVFGLAGPAHAQTPADQPGWFGSSSRFVQQDGEEIYRAVCQSCHMPEGEGAEGAGAGYPALADNDLLEAAGYPVYLVLHGQAAMPPLGSYLDDEQVAAVVNYIRTSFGNDFTEPATAEDVALTR